MRFFKLESEIKLKVMTLKEKRALNKKKKLSALANLAELNYEMHQNTQADSINENPKVGSNMNISILFVYLFFFQYRKKKI